MHQAQIRGDSLWRHALTFRTEFSEACSESEAFMLMRQNIQNNDSLTIKTLYRVLSPKIKRALFNHLVLLPFNTTFQRIQEFYVAYFFWFLEWVLQIFLIFVYTLRFSSHKQRVMAADKIRFPLLLVSCFISLFRPKDLTFPIFLNVFDRKLLLKTSSKNFNG